MERWIGVDLDGTLAEHYWPQKAPFYSLRIGAPIPAMVERVQTWIAQGKNVKIFTARVDGSHDTADVKTAIQAWCAQHIGCELEVTCRKDIGMIELWDDRAVRVMQNTGEPCCERAHS